MKHTLTLSTALLLVASAAMSLTPRVDGAGFYVAPTGNDANPGSASAPFRTLERAQSAMRAVSQSMNSGIKPGYSPRVKP